MKRSRGRGREPHDLVLSPLPAVDSRICSHFHHPRPDLQTRHHHRIKNEELFFPLLVMSLLTREIKKALLFAAHTESIIEFLTWVWLSVTFQRSRGRKTGEKNAGTIPASIPLMGEQPERVTSPPRLPTSPEFRSPHGDEEGTELPGPKGAPPAHVPKPLPQGGSTTPYSRRLKKSDFFLGSAFGRIKGLTYPW